MLTIIIFYAFFCALLCFLFVASFLLRDSPGFSSIWKCFKYFFIVGLLNLGGNYAKKSVKEWWNKD